MKYAIVYSSRTGNTALLAQTIRDTLPQEDCIYFGEPDPMALEAQQIYAGFWTDKGLCNEAAADFIRQLKDKQVFLFGTAGFGRASEYLDQILDRTRQLLPKSAKLMGKFMCQGKMPISVRERYVKMRTDPDHAPNLELLIENFDEALSHPDQQDLDALRQTVLLSLR